MGGGIHALKKAITTVIKAIEHMREIEVSLTTNSISTGNGVNEFAPVLRENESGFLFLKSKILTVGVEDFLIVPARYAGCSGISSEDFDGSRMILDLFLEIDELGHDKERRGDNFWSNA
jgi:hypothetical protein